VGEADQSSGSTRTEGSQSAGAKVNVEIARDNMPGAIYSNAMQAQVTSNELFLNFGLAMPPAEPVPAPMIGSFTLRAEYVARVVLPVAVIDQVIAQLNEARALYQGLQTIIETRQTVEHKDD
jgi:hypothetical protein